MPVGTPGVSDIRIQRRKLELPELIHYVYPNDGAFYTFTTKGVKSKRTVDDPKFYVREKREIPHKGVSLGGFSWVGNKATFNPSTDGVTADSTFLFVNALVHFPAPSGEPNASPFVARVESVDSTTNEVTVVGVGTVYDVAAGDKFMLLAPAYADGANRGTVIWREGEEDYNYTQIRRLPAEVTYRLYTTKLHGPDAMADIKRDTMRLWKQYSERQSLFGARGSDVENGRERTYSEGFVTWLKRKAQSNSNVQIINHATALANYQWDDAVDDLEAMSRFGKPKKFAFCPRDVLKNFSKIAFSQNTGRWNFTPRTNSFGIKIWSLETTFLVLDLVECQTLSDDYSKMMVIVDPGSIRKVVLRGWDTKWLPLDVPGVALKGQEIYEDSGLEMWAPETHGIISWAS